MIDNETIHKALGISEDEYEKLYQSLDTIKTSIETIAKQGDL